MKVFLSWSGHKSHQVAIALRDWLPSVIQCIMPYVSSEDIDKGARWSTDIAKELEDSTFGILCVTKENVEAPWLLFEAGALSKMMDKAFVCPFIFDLKRAEVKGPILQFQSTIFEKNDVKKLVLSLNKACGNNGLKEELLNKSFEIWWSILEESLNKIKDEKQDEKTESKEKSTKNEILEEILELARTNQKILRSPELLLPPDYFENLYKDKLNKRKFTEEDSILLDEQRILNMEIEQRIFKLREMIEYYASEKKTVDEELYLCIRRLMNIFQRQQMLINKRRKRIL